MSALDVLRVRFECADAGAAEFRLQVMDPATWKQCGPYAMRFRSIEEAVAWVRAIATVREDDLDVAEIGVGSVLLGTAPAEPLKAIVSALQAAGALLLPGAPPWWVYELPPMAVASSVDRARPEASVVVEEDLDLDEDRLGFAFHSGPSFGPGVLEFRYGSREPVLLADARIEEWAQTGRGRVVVVYFDALSQEPFFVTLNADPSPEGDGFILSTDEMGDVKVSPFDTGDVSWLSRFPFGHDARSADQLVGAYASFMRRNGRAYDVSSDTPLEFIHAVTEPDGEVITRITYGFVAGDEDIPDIYFHPQFERRGGQWVPCERALSFDHEVCIVEPYAAQALLPLFDAGAVVPTSVMRLGVVESDVEFIVGSLPSDVELFLRAALRAAWSEFRDEELGAVRRLEHFVNAGATLQARTLVSDVAEVIGRLHAAGIPIERSHDASDLTLSASSVTLPDAGSDTGERLIEFTAALLSLANEVIVEVKSAADEHFATTIRVRRAGADRRDIVAEIASPVGKDLEPALVVDGWQEPTGNGALGFHRAWSGDDAAPGDVAAALLGTLWEVFGADVRDVYRFEPASLVAELLQGNFGPRFMLDALTVGDAS